MNVLRRCAAVAAVLGLTTTAGPSPAGARTLLVVLAPSALDARGSAIAITYRGVRGVELRAPDDTDGVMPLVKGTALAAGTIDIDVSGDTRRDAPANVRGFVGIAFDVASPAQYECFYLRMKNGRSSDQTQRNHSAQYMSVPGGGWKELRAASPGAYESYVDLVPGAWTHLRIDVTPNAARLFVNRSPQPTLIAQRLRHGTLQPRPVALWIGPGTIAHFANLRVRSRPAVSRVAASFAGNAVFLVPSARTPSIRLRLDTGGYDFVTAAAAARAHLTAATVRLGTHERRTYALPLPSPLAHDALLEDRPGNLATIFVEPPAGTLSLGRFRAQLLTIDFRKKTVELATPGSGERVAMIVGRSARPAPRLVESTLALVPVTIDGRTITMLLDTGTDVAIPAALRSRFDDAGATRSLPLLSPTLFKQFRARHPDWPVLDAAARMAETKRAVTLLRIPAFRIGSHVAAPTWFAVREDASTYEKLSRMFGKPVQGDLGGEALRAWRVTIDVAHEALFVE